MPAAKDAKASPVKASHPLRPDWEYAVLTPSKAEVARLQKPFPLPRTCAKACTAVLQLLPKTLIQPHTGIGYQMINVDGFRYLNAYVISDALNSTNQRGFSLSLSFSVVPFVYGVGVVGEADFFFAFDTWFDPGKSSHGTVMCQTSDRTTSGGLPRIGGVDLCHVLRVPVMGPYVRAAAFNEDTVARNAEVRAYLTT